MLQNHFTLQQTRQSLYQELRKVYPEGESASIVRLILDHIGYPATECISNPQREPGSATIAQINEIVSEIHTHKPIQYILGYTYFCDLKIGVNENVLIPRPETEEMVYKIFNRYPHYPGRIMDLGTGSGCIALALKHRFPEAMVSGLDLSMDALELAAENSRNNRLDVNWMEGNILKGASWKGEDGFDLIVSNPPYVLNSERSMMDANVLEFEPQQALFVDDHDPLVFYDEIAAFCRKFLNDGGSLWVEINERFGTETALLFEKAGLINIAILKDIHEKERFIKANR
ncbi:MAG: peptide chain release factor N(5)-glutamine methyltransferase [Bacteroidales bacterium]|nr:peptide chain release factor N(5)-glutamine methyltransferase [Bacteroidales bacterium]